MKFRRLIQISLFFLFLFLLWLAVTASFVFDAMHKGKPLPWNLSLFALLVLISGYEAFVRQSTQ